MFFPSLQADYFLEAGDTKKNTLLHLFVTSEMWLTNRRVCSASCDIYTRSF